jgi:hypothetical protein
MGKNNKKNINRSGKNNNKNKGKSGQKKQNSMSESVATPLKTNLTERFDSVDEASREEVKIEQSNLEGKFDHTVDNDLNKETCGNDVEESKQDINNSSLAKSTISNQESESTEN